jgi:hypothetical protein
MIEERLGGGRPGPHCHPGGGWPRTRLPAELILHPAGSTRLSSEAVGAPGVRRSRCDCFGDGTLAGLAEGRRSLLFARSSPSGCPHRAAAIQA